MVLGSLAVAVLGVAAYVNASPKPGAVSAAIAARDELPAQVQRINQKAFNVLPTVLPVTESNVTTVRFGSGAEFVPCADPG